MAYYDASHLNKLLFIRQAKETGMPLMAIHKEIQNREKEQPNAFSGDGGALAEEEKRPLRQKNSSNIKGKETRESIIELACRLFREKGYKETRVSDITKALQVGKGTFYFYFSDKKELLLECVPRIFNELFSSGWDKIRKERDPLKRLELRAQAVLPVLQEFCSIVHLCKEALEDPDPKVQQLGKQTLLSIRGPLESDIAKGIDQGIFQPVNPKIGATLMIGIMEDLYYLQNIDKELTPDAVWEDVMGLIISGIKGVAKGGCHEIVV